MTQEIKTLAVDVQKKGKKQRKAESIVYKGFLKVTI